MGVAIASAYKTQHDVHGDGTAHIIGVMGALILVGLGFVLGLLALVPKLRLVVVALAVIGSFWLLRCCRRRGSGGNPVTAGCAPWPVKPMRVDLVNLNAEVLFRTRARSRAFPATPERRPLAASRAAPSGVSPCARHIASTSVRLQRKRRAAYGDRRACFSRTTSTPLIATSQERISFAAERVKEEGDRRAPRTRPISATDARRLVEACSEEIQSAHATSNAPLLYRSGQRRASSRLVAGHEAPGVVRAARPRALRARRRLP